MNLAGLELPVSNTPPNTDYLELRDVKISATGFKGNTLFIMENVGNGTFKISNGQEGIRVGRNKPRISFHPINEWESVYQQKIGSGYRCTAIRNEGRTEVVNDSMSVDSIGDISVRTLVKALLDYQKEFLASTVKNSIRNIPSEMIVHAGKILDFMSENAASLSVAEFVALQKTLYACIPRKGAGDIRNYASSENDFFDIISKERDFYDVVVSQLRHEAVKGQDILEAHNLNIRSATKDEEKEALKVFSDKSSRKVTVFRVENSVTQGSFNGFKEKNNLSNDDISLLCHGSRSENWWSIITNGLNIRPQAIKPDVVITGKAYGQGIYFAPDARKSMGYTSMSGSKWANGDRNVAYMGLYEVATGKYDTRYHGEHGCDSTIDYTKLQSIKKGALCTWAECRYSGFMMDEVIVYKNEQANIKYLLEIEQ